MINKLKCDDERRSQPHLRIRAQPTTSGRDPGAVLEIEIDLSGVDEEDNRDGEASSFQSSDDQDE